MDYHEYPSGARVIRAFVPDDFEFYDKNGRRILTIDETSLDNLGHMFAQWKRQKNGQNGQKRMIQADHKHPRLCPVRNALLLILRKMRLGHSMLLPIAIFKNKKGEIKYLTGSKIAEVLQKAAKAVHPDLSETEIKKFTAHSIRVWACVLLDEAGKSPDFIKNKLRWMGESYRIYLRDTAKSNKQHNEALEEMSQSVISLLEANLEDSFVPLTEEELNGSGEYDDGN